MAVALFAAFLAVPAEEDEEADDGFLVEDAYDLVAEAFELDGLGRTTYLVEASLQVAEVVGLDGSTEKRPTPVSQQSVVWSQQYDVSVFVTFEHDIRSVPPVEAPRHRRGQPGACPTRMAGQQYSLRQKFGHPLPQSWSVQEPRMMFPSELWHRPFPRQTLPSEPLQHELTLALGLHG